MDGFGSNFAIFFDESLLSFCIEYNRPAFLSFFRFFFSDGSTMVSFALFWNKFVLNSCGLCFLASAVFFHKRTRFLESQSLHFIVCKNSNRLIEFGQWNRLKYLILPDNNVPQCCLFSLTIFWLDDSSDWIYYRFAFEFSVLSAWSF